MDLHVVLKGLNTEVKTKSCSFCYQFAIGPIYICMDTLSLSYVVSIT